MNCVDAPSPQHEPRAYVPRDPDADREDDWPPASRELAIEYARQARLEEGGLPVDDATLELVADAIMDPEAQEAGLFFTAEELAEEERVDEGDDPGCRAAEEYLRRHPEIDGGVRLGWRDGRRMLFVALVGDADAHKAEIARIGGARVAFERVPRTVTELDAIQARVTADRSELVAAGFHLLVVGTDRQHGVVRAHVVGGLDAAAAEEYFAGRYGDAVAVEWLGPSRHREVPHPFGSWTSEGRLLRVFFGLDHNGQRRGSARVAEESGERIVIALSRLQPLGATFLIGGFQPQHADLELREPVGSRAVVDASAGVVRPSLAQRRNRLRPGGRRDRSDALALDVTEPRVEVPTGRSFDRKELTGRPSFDPGAAEILFFSSSEDVPPNREQPEGG
jgi:hypothetical protein